MTTTKIKVINCFLLRPLPLMTPPAALDPGRRACKEHGYSPDLCRDAALCRHTYNNNLYNR